MVKMTLKSPFFNCKERSSKGIDLKMFQLKMKNTKAHF